MLGYSQNPNENNPEQVGSITLNILLALEEKLKLASYSAKLEVFITLTGKLYVRTRASSPRP